LIIFDVNLIITVTFNKKQNNKKLLKYLNSTKTLKMFKLMITIAFLLFHTLDLKAIQIYEPVYKYKPAVFNQWMNEIAKNDTNRNKIRDWIKDHIPQTYFMQMEMEHRNPLSKDAIFEEKFSSLCSNALAISTGVEREELKKMLTQMNPEGAAKYKIAPPVPEHDCKAKGVKGGHCKICES
jgi:hypothetical protein